MLYDPERHVALIRSPWDNDRVRGAIREIAADTEAAFRGAELWPVHPGEEIPLGRLKNLYWGAAGVIWALHRLAERDAVRLTRDYSSALAGLHAAYLEEENRLLPNPAYMIGETGILLVELLLASSASTADRLHGALDASLATTTDLCFGAPGALVAANFAYQRTKDERWRAILQRHVDQLWSAWSYSPEAQCHLWVVLPLRLMGGKPATHLGACHGLAGCVMALMQAVELLPPVSRAELYRRCAEAYEKTAVVEDAGANWWRSVGDSGWWDNALWVQWCYGAPGMITAMRSFPRDGQPGGSAAMDTLLRQAAELTWRAGPLAKGPGLCHGTAGNGFAFLTMWERTGESFWLERARRFAMHAIAQSEESRAEHGRRRYSLWTGDLGVALFLQHCIEGTAGLPTLDYV